MNLCEQAKCLTSRDEVAELRTHRKRVVKKINTIQEMIDTINEMYSVGDYYQENTRAKNEFLGQLMQMKASIKLDKDRISKRIKEAKAELKKQKKSKKKSKKNK